MYEIELADGTKLENLKLNGNNFISKTLIDDSIFENNLNKVTITSEERTEEYEDMKLIQNKVYGAESWFILAEKTKEEKDREAVLQLFADLAELVLFGGV